jgi:DNA helicase-2/ATP-dependent DNA helicase PcrA
MKKTKINKEEYHQLDELIDKMAFPRKPFKAEPIPDVFVKIGDPLDHVRFGKGTVIEVDGEKCTVQFESGEKKNLLSKFAGFKL